LNAARQDMSHAMNSPDGGPLGPVASLRRRVYLTYRYLGWRTLAFRFVTFPLRFTPLRHRLQLRSRAGQDAYRRALAWYREDGRPGWLACLQYAASQEDDVAVVGARLLYPDGRIQFAGAARNLGAPEWFDHRYRFKPADWGPAGIAGPVLAVTGACMYIRREA